MDRFMLAELHTIWDSRREVSPMRAFIRATYLVWEVSAALDEVSAPATGYPERR